jgi:DNA-binding CsgD family transcriptional regulator
VFVGGFDADAAESVAPGLSFDVLARLADKSLIVVVRGEEGRTRYRLLETVREYAYGLLAEAGELDGARDRHLGHYAGLAATDADGWPSTRAEQTVNELQEDYENLRAALEWAAASDPCAGLRLLGSSRDVFMMLGQADGYRLATVLLECCHHRDVDRARVQVTAGMLAFLMTDAEGAKSVLAEARELSAELGDVAIEGWAVLFQGLTHALGGDGEAASEHFEASRALHRRSGTRIGEAGATAVLGLTRMMAGDSDEARDMIEGALSIQVAEKYHWGQGQANIYLGLIAASDGSDPERATRHFRAAVDALRGYQDPTLLTVALIGQAGVLVRREPEKALAVTAAASAARARAGGDFAPVYRAHAERVKEEAEARLGAEARGIWAEGSRLGRDDAIALAFGTTRAEARSAGPSGLSARELEVAGLVAEGLPNKAIAARLQLSVRTVESHVRHALTKLALDNRTQLASWARERIQ